MSSNLSPEKIDKYRSRLLANMGELELDRVRIRPAEYNQLMNYHNYLLNILDNMKNLRLAELTNPYNQSMYSVVDPTRPAGSQGPLHEMKVIYRPDGRTVIEDKLSNQLKPKEGWEAQFDEGVINPPAGMIPPSKVWAPRKGFC